MLLSKKKKYFPIITLFMLLSCNSYNLTLVQDNDLISKKKSVKSFEKFIWYRNSDSVIVINKKSLNKIYKKTNSSDERYFESLDTYNSSILNTSNSFTKKISFTEKAFLSGHVINTLYKCQEKLNINSSMKDYKFIYGVLSLLNNDNNNYNREFKKHDYYGLKLLKKHHLKHYKYFPDRDTIPSIKRLSD